MNYKVVIEHSTKSEYKNTILVIKNATSKHSAELRAVSKFFARFPKSAIISTDIYANA